MTDVKQYRDDLEDQNVSEKERDNWISQEEVGEVYNNLHKSAYHLFQKKKLTPNETRHLMNLIILSLYYLIPPRRSMDYIEFKTRNIDPEKDNYMKGLKFVFNKYKTAHHYGRQEVPISRTLNALIKKWIDKFPNQEYLLFDDNNGSKLNATKLTNRLYSIFDGRKVGVNQLRKTYLTEKYKALPEWKDMQKTANSMGHDIGTALEQYVKPEMNKGKK